MMSMSVKAGYYGDDPNIGDTIYSFYRTDWNGDYAFSKPITTANNFKLGFLTYFDTINKQSLGGIIGWIDDDAGVKANHNRGLYAGGYFYNTKYLNSIEFELKSRSTDKTSWRTYGNYQIYDLSKLNPNSNNDEIKEFLRSNQPIRGDKFGPVDDDFGDNDGDSTTAESFSLNTINLPPGIYYLAFGVGGHAITDMNDKDDIESSLKIIEMNLQTIPQNSKLNFMSSYGWAITNTLLTQNQLNTEFKEQVEEIDWLCNAAGGSMNITPIPEEHGLTTCCGNTIDDYGHSYEYEGKTYYCSPEEKKWLENTNQNVCYSLVVENSPLSKKENVYLTSYDDRLKWFQVDEEPGIFDGCCGDDYVEPNQCIVNEEFSCGSLNEDLGKGQPRVDSCADYGCEEKSNRCIGPQICEGTTKAECLSDSKSESCIWTGDGVSKELAQVDRFSGGRYFCTKDTYINNDEERLTYPSDSERVTWKWWDAKEHNVPFKIHSILGTDYISNGKSWYYCNATGNIDGKSNSIPNVINEEGTFPLSTTGLGSFRCVDTLNTMVTEYFSKNPDESNYLDGFKKANYFTTCQNETHDDYCCIDRKYPDEDVYYEQGDFKEVCGEYCYIDNAIYLSELTSDLNFKEIFCKKYPWDSSMCAEYLDEDVPFGKEPNGVKFVPKKDCSFSLNGCFSEAFDTDLPCQEIQDHPLEGYEYINAEGQSRDEYEGYLCEYEKEKDAFQYCASGLYAQTSDTINDESSKMRKVCCLVPEKQYTKETACINVNQEMTPSVCAKINGDYFADYKNNPGNAHCDSPGINQDGCCIGAKWEYNWDKLAYASLTQNASFICYEHANESRIAECCTEFSPCNNYDYDSATTSIFLGAKSQDRTYFGSGGSIHNVENFDDWFTSEISEKLVDYVMVRTGVGSSPSERFKIDIKTDFRDNDDWSSFQYLEFDVAFNLNKTEKIILYSEEENSRNRIECSYNFDDQLVNGKKPMRWHHAVLNLTSNQSCSDFNWKKVVMIELKPYEHYTTGYSIAADNFFLSGNRETYFKNTDNYYCTGNFGSWVKNLDGPGGNQGFIEEVSFQEYGKYWYACESQASYAWTGKRCCGDDTKKPYVKGTTNYGEYYVDLSMACFSGTPIFEDWRVGDALNDNETNGLLFYDGEFQNCIAGDYKELQVSYGDTFGKGKLVTKEHTPFTIVGDYYCDSTGDWERIEDMPRSKIIASKLYNLTFNKNNNQIDSYDIVCDTLDKATPNTSSVIRKGMPALFITEGKEEISDFCTLSYDDSKKQKILVGLSLTVPINEFLESLYKHIEQINIYTELSNDFKEEFLISCDNVGTGYSRNDDFFTLCENTISYDNVDLKMAYNSDFNILFLAFTDDKNDFNELFKGEKPRIAQFFDNFVSRFIGLFDNWFATKDGNDNNYDKETVLPMLLDENVNFKQIFVSKRGSKIIQAYQTKYKHTENFIEENLPVLSVNYYGFQTYLDQLGLAYYNDYDESLNYLLGENEQAIMIKNPQKDRAFENEFDWRTFTTSLRYTSEQFTGVNPIKSEINDGRIGLNEQCDKTAEGTDVFRNDNNDCNQLPQYKNFKDNCANLTCRDGSFYTQACSGDLIASKCDLAYVNKYNDFIDNGEQCDYKTADKINLLLRADSKDCYDWDSRYKEGACDVGCDMNTMKISLDSCNNVNCFSEIFKQSNTGAFDSIVNGNELCDSSIDGKAYVFQTDDDGNEKTTCAQWNKEKYGDCSEKVGCDLRDNTINYVPCARGCYSQEDIVEDLLGNCRQDDGEQCDNCVNGDVKVFISDDESSLCKRVYPQEYPSSCNADVACEKGEIKKDICDTESSCQKQCDTYEKSVVSETGVICEEYKEYGCGPTVPIPYQKTCPTGYDCNEDDGICESTATTCEDGDVLDGLLCSDGVYLPCNEIATSKNINCPPKQECSSEGLCVSSLPKICVAGSNSCTSYSSTNCPTTDGVCKVGQQVVSTSSYTITSNNGAICCLENTITISDKNLVIADAAGIFENSNVEIPLISGFSSKIPLNSYFIGECKIGSNTCPCTDGNIDTNVEGVSSSYSNDCLVDKCVPDNACNTFSEANCPTANNLCKLQ